MSLKGKVCLVTGASRGIGRGIALALGSEGATVYITGRTLNPVSNVPGSLSVTAEEVSGRGGKAVPVKCDHGNDQEILELFERIKRDEGRLDLLVNNALKGVATIGKYGQTPFWEAPLESWDDVIHVGLRCHYVAAIEAAKIMTPQKSGLIVNVSSAGALFNFFTIPYGVGKAGVDKMAEMGALQLKKHNVAFVSLWPGLVQTEYIVNQKDRIEQATVKGVKMNVAKGETVEYAGRAIVGLMNDRNIMKKTGKTMMTPDLGDEYGFTDVDGRKHGSLRSPKSWISNWSPALATFVPAFIKVPWAWVIGAVHHYY